MIGVPARSAAAAAPRLAPAVLAIDPGPVLSAWLLLGSDGRPQAFDRVPNEQLLDELRTLDPERVDVVAIEQIEPRFGLSPGMETLDTARFVGRFEEAARPTRVERLKRSEILRHLGVVTRGPGKTTADAGVRAALIDRYGGPAGKDLAIGRKASPGPLYGISADCWAALSVAVTFVDQEADR